MDQPNNLPAAAASPPPCAREIDALIAITLFGWDRPRHEIDHSGDRGWGQKETGGPWLLKRWYGEWDPAICDYPSETLETITETEFCERYYWRSPGGEYIRPRVSFSDPPIKFSSSPTASKMLRDKMRADGWKSCLFSTDLFTMRYWGYKRGQDTIEAHADTEEMAVALAALRALGMSLQGSTDGETPQAEKADKVMAKELK